MTDTENKNSPNYKRQMEKDNKNIKDISNSENPNSFLVDYLFDNDSFLHFAYKKSDRLVAAIYLVSNALSDNEPIKLELREGGLCLINEILSLTRGSPIAKSDCLNKCLSHIFKTISLLEISRIAGLVSEMNFAILKAEFEHLLQIIRMTSVKRQEKGIPLKNDFFAVTREQISKEDLFGNGPERGAVKDTYDKGQFVIKDNLSKGHFVGKSEKPTQQFSANNKISPKKSAREGAIMSLLKIKNNLSIKDFSKGVRGCSEKTIQRILIRLTNLGVLKKEGERRWTRYSLAH